MKPKTKAQLRETLRLLAIERDALRITGAQMANLCFNLSQEQVSIDRLHMSRGIMKDLYKQWDSTTKVDI